LLLQFARDDGIVVSRVDEMERLTVAEYFRMPETQRPMELVHGIVREPPAPRYGHQSVVTRLTALLEMHVRERGLGRVCVSPVDVVLDEPGALVVQPDILFVSNERLHIVRSRIWGAPDLVVEVLSPRTARRDRATKLPWYAHYGVRECWLADPRSHSIEVHWLAGGASSAQLFKDAAPIRSAVLPEWRLPAGQAFS